MTNHFTLLALPRTFDLDAQQLESAYFIAQRHYHPDRFVNKSPAEKLEAAQKSADVNEAYNTLKSPMKRAAHLLALSGITVLDAANSAKPDMALLTEIMELQEAIEDGNSPDIAGLIRTCENELAEAFKRNDNHRAKNSTIRLSYLYKLHQTI